MLTCEECGCLVDPELTETHESFHLKLMKLLTPARGSVANPNRTKLNELPEEE